MSVLFTKEGRISELNVNIANGNTNYRVGLFKNNVTVTADTVLSDLTVADYSGNGLQTPVFPSAAADGSGDGSSVAPTLTFSHNGGGTANTIYGWFMKDIASGKTVQVSNLAAPKSMGASGDTIAITVTLKEKQG